MHLYLDLANFPQCLLRSANCPHLPHADAAQHPECVSGLGYNALFLLDAGLSYLISGVISVFVIPFIPLAKRKNKPSDIIEDHQTV